MGEKAPAEYPLRYRKTLLTDQVFCQARQRWVSLTPEEWVRQQLLARLQYEHGVPEPLMAVEKKLPLGGRYGRYDLVVYSRMGFPALLAECKAPDESLNEKALLQTLRYQATLGAVLMVLTSHVHTYCWAMPQAERLAGIPHFSAWGHATD